MVVECGVLDLGGVARPEMLLVRLGDCPGLENCRRTAGGVAGFLIGLLTLVRARDMLRGKVCDLFMIARLPGRLPIVSLPVARRMKIIKASKSKGAQEKLHKHQER